MYAGRVAEIGPVADVIHKPRHPYTAGLMGSIPALDSHAQRLVQIDGSMPRLNAIPTGCAFNPRCGQKLPRCTQDRPELMAAGTSAPPVGFMKMEPTPRPHGGLAAQGRFCLGRPGGKSSQEAA